ncbi:asparagine synthase (glutamine-hydrolyzing) [Micromonospora sp. NPDC048830]|uniref:asparagine synthase (glutamine-hydrolyzing) n=1 Tax=Micromonospora sp. NPDC048830 TaxID=3364257 RepID=UPI0037224D04
MCRIYGYFNARPSRNEVRAVAALQRHGGPDSTGSTHAPGWGVGNNRLAIVDLDGGAQPYELDDRIAVVFNGEIYNHDELREMLRARGYAFADRCDGGIIPALYDAYGEGFTDLLDGMYAIAVLDRRDVPTLLLVTDPAGMKPLYYRWDPAERSLYFSSEIPALLGFQAVGTDLWQAGLDAYLATKTPFGEQTMFGDVKVLPPATTLRCELDGQPRLRIRRLSECPPVTSLDTAARLVRDRLAAEVGRLLVADVPVAVVTSGGLDSSLVTALAARHRPVHSFNVAYRGSWPFDERGYAERVARSAGTVHHQVELDPAAFPSMIEDVVWHLGQPNADPITLSTYGLFAAVHDAGFKVALTGDAADEVFGGYSRMRAAVAGGSRADWLPRYLDELAVLPAERRYALYADEYQAFVRHRLPIPPEALDLLHTGAQTVLGRILAFEQRYRLPAYHLRRVDHLSMASAVEVRLPFCQPGVLSLGRALGDDLRIRGDEVKRALYGAARGLLPDEVLSRPKQPFTLPVTAMLRPGQPLWEYGRDMLAGSRLAAGGRLDPVAVDALFTAQSRRPRDETAVTIWALLVYEVWLDQFQRDRRTAGAAAVTT